MQQPRVLEIGGGVAASYATRLLADQGADVIKLEPPAGDALRSRDRNGRGLFIALNLGKRSIILDLPAESGKLAEWLAWADILVHSLPAEQAQAVGLDAESLQTTHPSLVTLAVTPFGQTGPYAGYQATELILANAGGWANVCPATHEDPDLPPLKVYGDQCQMMAAIAGAMTALATWLQCRHSGVGEFIDLSIQSYVASVLEAALPAYSYRGEVVSRRNLRSLIPWRIFQAQDAPVFVVCIEQDQWQRLVEFMGNPEWAQMEVFADALSRQENQDLVHLYVQEFVSQWTADALYHAAQQHRICVAPVLSVEQMYSNEHLKARDFWQTLQQPGHPDLPLMGPAVVVDGHRPTIARPAPQLGEHNHETPGSKPDVSTQASHNASAANADLPLAGIRVLDMTWAWAGPFCSMNLAHLGAEVIRIESAKRADLYRRLPIYPPGIEEGLNCSGMFNQWNQGKASIALDLATAAGIELVKDLVAVSDVVVQNFATGVMERLGLGYRDLQAINPGIILASISGYGQSGPYREYMGYGPAIPPLTGLSAATGYVGGEAEEIGLSMPDPTAGITAAWAVVNALHQRQHSGTGAHLDVTLWESTAVLNAEGWMGFAMHGECPQRMGNRSTHMSPHGTFRCLGEDRWIALAVRDDAQWQLLAGLIDPALVEDPRFVTLAGRQADEDALEQIISAWCANHDRWWLTHQLQALGLAAFPSLDTRDIADDPHLNARGFIERLAHPEVGARAHAGIPWRFSRRANGVRRPAPCLDADTDRLLAELLHKDPATIRQLREQQITGC